MGEAERPPAAGAAIETPGIWIVTDDPRTGETARRVVEGIGITARALEALPSPSEVEPPVRPDWLLADLSSRTIAPADLEAFKREHRECQLFLLAGDPRSPVPAELARLGVRHWFLPPLDGNELRRVLRAALRSRRAEMGRLRSREVEFPTFDSLIGVSASFREACDIARKAATSPSTVVLIEGETGTGKGLFARAIHRESPRVSGPYIEVNCASLPGQTLESELFGHDKGAFTDARAAKPGLLELADSGTFFLDEVAETAPEVQAKILKFLDSGQYRRVGGIEEREVDVRVLAATQKDLEAEARGGFFRVDLFHRLHVVRVRIPPLRERPGDVRLLLEHFLRRYAVRLGRPNLTWSREALDLLERHSWPGNVREVVNLCERVVLLSAGSDSILPSDLPEPVEVERRARVAREGEGKVTIELPEGVTFVEVKRAVLEAALEKTRGNVSKAAANLGMGRGEFRHQMEKLGMTDASAKERPRRRARRRG